MDEYLFFLFFFNGLSPIWDVIQTWYIHPRRSSYMTGKECYFSLSCLNSQLSPYLRNSRPMAIEPHTATSSEKAKNAINAIVFIIVFFKNLWWSVGNRTRKDPFVSLLVHRCPHGLGGDRLAPHDGKR